MIKWNPIMADDGGKRLIRYFRNNHAIDWPLRTKEKQTIIVNPYLDWMDRSIPTEWQSLLLATMSLATRHTFITVTSEHKNLVSMLGQIDALRERTVVVPADPSYLKALVKANVEFDKFGFVKDGWTNALMLRAEPQDAIIPPTAPMTPFQSRARVLWPPRNVIFGFLTEVGDESLKPLLYNMKANWGWEGIRTAIYAPGTHRFTWELAGLAELVDYIFTDENFVEVINEAVPNSSPMG